MYELTEILIPVTVFVSIVIVFLSLLKFNYKIKKEYLDSIQKAITQNPAISASTIKEIARHLFNSSKDLRKAVFLLCTSIALLVFSYLVDFPQNGNVDLNDMINGVAFFPGLFSFAFFILHKIEKK